MGPDSREPGDPTRNRTLKMPQHLIERAQAIVAAPLARERTALEGWAPPELRHAATVVLVRTRPTAQRIPDEASQNAPARESSSVALEVYLQRRVRTMAFAAGMYVFPGGAVEPTDIEQAMEWLAAADASTLPLYARWAPDAIGEDTLAARFAAVRETAEEAGVELGPKAATELTYVAHWATPAVEDRRFDTRFYAVALDSAQQASQTSTESDDHRWVTPQQALADYAAGEMLMLPPTVAVLAALAEAIAETVDSDATHTPHAFDVASDDEVRADPTSEAAAVIDMLTRRPIVPLMPHPVADPSDPSGIRWSLVDVRTFEEVAASALAPAGSESGGVHTSLVDREGRPS